MKALFVTALLILAITPLLKAQEKDDQVLQNLIEEILEEADEEIDYTTIVDNLTQYFENPLNLNDAGRSDLLLLYFLSIAQINEILAYRSSYGEFVSIYELKAIPSLDPKTLRRLYYFVEVKPAGKYEKIKLKNLKYGRQDFFLRTQQVLEKSKGYKIADTSKLDEVNKYPGSPQRLYFRWHYQYRDNISVGLTAEKDPGEDFFSGAQKNGFDFYSAHAFLANRKNIKALALGDYQAQFGQGLIMWSGLSFSKTPNVLGIAKSPRGILPYRSVNENLFLRGAATTIELGKYDLSVFYSRKQLDANINGDDTGGVTSFTSFTTSGYHRTQSEISDKDAIREQVTGFHLERSGKSLNLGITGLWTGYDQPLQAEGKLYKKFEFSGTSFYNLGVDYAYIYKKLYAFGEFGISDNGAVANINGLLFNFGNSAKGGIIYRNYPKDYHALWANAFREGTRVNNEQGLYLAFIATPFPRWSFSLYYDQFKFPWLRYLVDAPSHGSEFLGEVNYYLNRRVSMYWRYKIQVKDKNVPENATPMNIVRPNSRENLRYHITYDPVHFLSFRSRIELSRFQIEDQPAQDGVLMFQDVIFRLFQDKLKITGRYAYFDVSSFDARIYAFENDVLYAFSIPFFQDEGIRYYVLLNYEFNRHLEAWIRFAQTNYFYRESIGSGLDQIDANVKSEVKVQLRFRF